MNSTSGIHSVNNEFLNNVVAVLAMLAVGALLFSCNVGGRCRETENSSSGFYLNSISTWELIAT